MMWTRPSTECASDARATRDQIRQQTQAILDTALLSQLYDAITEMVVILNQQRQITGGEDCFDGAIGAILKFGQGQHVIGINAIDQVMRHSGQLIRRWFGGADVHLAVNLPRVGGDNLPAKLLRQRNTQRRFADSGRPDNGN